MAQATLGTVVDGLAREPGRTAIVTYHGDEAVRWRCGELHERVLRMAAGLRAAGVRDGAAVALLGPPQPSWIAALLAIVGAGGLAVPLADGLPAEEIRRLLEHSGARHLFFAMRRLDEMRGLARERTAWLLDDEGGGSDDAPPSWRRLLDSDPAELPELDAGEPACLLYTSGTTGAPKGVPLTHRNLLANVDALREAGLATQEDRILVPLPLHHTYPLTVGVLGSLALGATLVLPEGMAGPQILKAAEAGRATVMVGVPRLYSAIVEGIEARVKGKGRLARRLFGLMLSLSVGVRRRTGWRIGRLLFGSLHKRLGGALRLLGSGGARLDPEIAWKLEGFGFEVLIGYGLTETAPILTFNRRGKARLDSVGEPVPGVEIRVDRDAVANGDGRQGEILARGPNVFAGYRNNPEATDAAFADGWFRTGDLGFLDEDGHLLITGRAKELIVLAGGKNVFPEDVEAAFQEEAVFEEVAVLEREGTLVGLVRPNAESIRAQGAGRAGAILREAIEACSQRLPRHQRLAGYALVQSPLPRTQLGKLQRHLLPEIFERARGESRSAEAAVEPSEEDKALERAEPAREVLAWLKQRLDQPDLTLDTSPTLDLGLDSFAWMNLGLELEERFGLGFDEERLAGVMSVRDLLQEVQAAAERGPREGERRRQLSAEQTRWLEPPRPWHRALSFLLWLAAVVVMRGLFRLRVRGREHLPQDGAVVITPNHASYLDPFAVAAALPWSRLRRIYWAGWTGIVFTGPITRFFSRTAQVVPVDPDRGVGASLALGQAVLERGHGLVWFPEGRRTLEGELQPFLPGVGALLQGAEAPALPVWIGGSFEALPPERSLPRLRRIEVVFGEPVPAEELRREGDPARIAEMLQERVAALGRPG